MLRLEAILHPATLHDIDWTLEVGWRTANCIVFEGGHAIEAEFLMLLEEYIWLRAMELEGRPQSDAGGWPITVKRLQFGEGVPLRNDSALGKGRIPAGVPLPAVPVTNLRKGHAFRPHFYRRIRSATDAAHYLLRYAKYASPVQDEIPTPISLAFKLFPDWTNPPNGYIPEPKPDAMPLATSHCIGVYGLDKEYYRFVFPNSWGKGWGDEGMGTLPGVYFDHYQIESWCAYHKADVQYEKRLKVGRNLYLSRTLLVLERGQRAHRFLLEDQHRDERFGWCFLLESEYGLEMEEFYVQPKHRRRGYGKLLTSQLIELIKARAAYLHVFVPFADCKSESPATFTSMTTLLNQLQCRYYPTPVIWAAYYGGNGDDGALSPLEPSLIPPRPKSTLEELAKLAAAAMLAAGRSKQPGNWLAAAAVLAAGLSQQPGNWQTADVAQVPLVHGPAFVYPLADRSSGEDFPLDLAVEEWDNLNIRRAQLLERRFDGTIGADEDGELDRLQQQSLEIIQRNFPISDSDRDALRAIEEQLGTMSKGVG